MDESPGSVQETVTLPSPPVAVSPAGAAGGCGFGAGVYGPAAGELVQPLQALLPLRARTPTT